MYSSWVVISPYQLTLFQKFNSRTTLMGHLNTNGPTRLRARFLSCRHNHLNCERARLESFSEDRVSLQLMRDWKEDRERWDLERSNFHAKDRSQSIIIAELKVSRPPLPRT